MTITKLGHSRSNNNNSSFCHESNLHNYSVFVCVDGVGGEGSQS